MLKATYTILAFSSIAGISFLLGYHFEKANVLDNFSKTTNEFIKTIQTRANSKFFDNISFDSKSLRAKKNVNSVEISLQMNKRISEIMQFGFPSYDNIRFFTDFVLSYDTRTRMARWVCEHLTKDVFSTTGNANRDNSEFYQDDAIHPYFRSYLTDYTTSGYDRGHLASSRNHLKSQAILNETFVLSNIAPQTGDGFNRYAWRDLENHVRDLTLQYSDVYVFTGPLYLPKKLKDEKMYVTYEVIGSNTVAVPTHFYKIALLKRQHGMFDVESYVMPNQVITEDTPLAEFFVPPETIESASGLLFFENVKKNKIIKINGEESKA